MWLLLPRHCATLWQSSHAVRFAVLRDAWAATHVTSEHDPTSSTRGTCATCRVMFKTPTHEMAATPHGATKWLIMCAAHLQLLHQLLPDRFWGRGELAQLENQALHTATCCLCLCAVSLHCRPDADVLQQVGCFLPGSCNVRNHACTGPGTACTKGNSRLAHGLVQGKQLKGESPVLDSRNLLDTAAF
jgi:hypothetical protein